jgi:DNA-binding NarL/FixJ family response regulator
MSDAMITNRIRSDICRIVCVDDDPLWFALMEKTISEIEQVSCVGAARSGAEAMSVCRLTKPDILVLDLILPDVDGLMLFTELRRVLPRLKGLFVSCRTDQYTLYRSMHEGSVGLVVKTIGCEAELRCGVVAAINNHAYYCATAREALDRFRRHPLAFYKILSAWEVQVLEHLSLGLSDQDVGERLELSPHTVHRHRSRIMAKLEVHDTKSLILAASQIGFETKPQRWLGRGLIEGDPK